MPINARKTEPFGHYERPKNCAMLSLASEWTKLLVGEIKVSHSPDFLPLRPPLLEGVLLLVLHQVKSAIASWKNPQNTHTLGFQKTVL